MAECSWDPNKHGGKPCPVHGAGGVDADYKKGSKRISSGKYQISKDRKNYEDVDKKRYDDLDIDEELMDETLDSDITIADEDFSELKKYAQRYDVDINKAKERYNEYVDRMTKNKTFGNEKDIKEAAMENTLDDIVMGYIDNSDSDAKDVEDVEVDEEFIVTHVADDYDGEDRNEFFNENAKKYGKKIAQQIDDELDNRQFNNKNDSGAAPTGSGFKNKRKLTEEEFNNYMKNHEWDYEFYEDSENVDGEEQKLTVIYDNGKHIGTYNKDTGEFFSDKEDLDNIYNNLKSIQGDFDGYYNLDRDGNTIIIETPYDKERYTFNEDGTIYAVSEEEGNTHTFKDYNELKDNVGWFGQLDKNNNDKDNMINTKDSDTKEDLKDLINESNNRFNKNDMFYSLGDDGRIYVEGHEGEKYSMSEEAFREGVKIDREEESEPFEDYSKRMEGKSVGEAFGRNKDFDIRQEDTNGDYKKRIENARSRLIDKEKDLPFGSSINPERRKRAEEISKENGWYAPNHYAYLDALMAYEEGEFNDDDFKNYLSSVYGNSKEKDLKTKSKEIDEIGLEDTEQLKEDLIRKMNKDENNEDEFNHLSNILKEHNVTIKPTPKWMSKYHIESNHLPYSKREEIINKLEKIGYEVQGDGKGNLDIYNSLNENQYNSKKNDYIIQDFLEQYGYKGKLSPEEKAVIAKILRLK